MTQPRNFLTPISALAVELRMGHTAWDQLDWFVTFAQKNLKSATEGEKLSLQEELAALELFTVFDRVRTSSSNVSLPDWGTAQHLQQTIFSWLTDWVDHDQVVLGPYTVKYEIKRVATDTDLIQAHHPFSQPQTQISGQEPFGQVNYLQLQGKNQAVLYRFTELFKEHGTAVTRCPHCLRIFLKLRKNARYCGRSCHSVAGMRAKRAKERELTKGKQSPKPGTKSRVKYGSKKRKEKPHGEERRKR